MNRIAARPCSGPSHGIYYEKIQYMKGDTFGRIISLLNKVYRSTKCFISNMSNYRYSNSRSHPGVKIHVYIFTYFLFRVLFCKTSCIDANAGRIRGATRWVILPIGPLSGNETVIHDCSNDFRLWRRRIFFRNLGVCSPKYSLILAALWSMELVKTFLDILKYPQWAVQTVDMTGFRIRTSTFRVL